jgi:5-deoxy-glucuronate isomerase
MGTLAQSQLEKMIFRKTNVRAGRHISVTPANSTNRHLSYGRIILRGETRSVTFKTAGQETGLIVLAGAAAVSVGGEDFALAQYDGIYLPRGSQVRIDAGESADIAEFSAPVKGQYPLQVIHHAEASKNPALTFTAGVPGQQRQVNIAIGKNVEAGRLVLGFTFSEPGNWTSWPPHEHTAMLEEMYVYINMPEPAFGIQLVYNDTEYPELVTVVRDGDAVLMPAGYHPNVAIPGHRIGFLWAMAAHREKEDRQFGVVNVQPSFSGSGSGLEASRK